MDKLFLFIPKSSGIFICGCIVGSGSLSLLIVSLEEQVCIMVLHPASLTAPWSSFLMVSFTPKSFSFSLELLLPQHRPRGHALGLALLSKILLLSAFS